MIAGQLGRVTGVGVSGHSVAAELASFVAGLGGLQPATVAVAGAVLIFLYVVRWRWPHAPGPLLAMLLATAAVAAFGLSGRGVSVVGPIPAGLPVPGLPDVHWHELRELLLPRSA
jgi:sulfate permease, SulP family